VRPDPGRDLLEARLAALTPEERARIAMDLRSRGFALAWDQLDRSGIRDPVERFLFLLELLHPEMPEAHREQVRSKLRAAHEAGTWHGPERPASSPPRGGG
jgi:hypothetical protein